MSLFFPPNRGQGLNPWGLFVPPLPTQSAGGPGLSLEEVPPCRTEGCRWHGHPEFGGLCSTCGEGWTPQRLEQLRLLAKEAEAETRARDFEDWDEPGVTFSPQEYDWLRRGVEPHALDEGTFGRRGDDAVLNLEVPVDGGGPRGDTPSSRTRRSKRPFISCMRAAGSSGSASS